MHHRACHCLENVHYPSDTAESIYIALKKEEKKKKEDTYHYEKIGIRNDLVISTACVISTAAMISKTPKKQEQSSDLYLWAAL